MEQKVRNFIGPKEFNQKFLKDRGVKMIGGGRQAAGVGDGLKVWAAEVNYSVLQRDSGKRRTDVPEIVAEEVERIFHKTVPGSVSAARNQGTDGMKS